MKVAVWVAIGIVLYEVLLYLATKFFRWAKSVEDTATHAPVKGHRLDHPQQFKERYLGYCECGTTVWGVDLPALWKAHDMHLRAVREMRKA